MSDLFWCPTDIEPSSHLIFPKSNGKSRLDDRRVLSGIIFINRKGLRWCDAPAEYGRQRTLSIR